MHLFNFFTSIIWVRSKHFNRIGNISSSNWWSRKNLSKWGWRATCRTAVCCARPLLGIDIAGPQVTTLARMGHTGEVLYIFSTFWHVWVQFKRETSCLTCQDKWSVSNNKNWAWQQNVFFHVLTKLMCLLLVKKIWFDTAKEFPVLIACFSAQK